MRGDDDYDFEDKIQIEFTAMNTFILKPDNRLYSFGAHSACLGRESSLDEDDKEVGEVIVSEDELIKKIATGKSHVLALTLTGKVYAWGKNDKGQLGIGEKGEYVY